MQLHAYEVAGDHLEAHVADIAWLGHDPSHLQTKTEDHIFLGSDVKSDTHAFVILQSLVLV